MNDIRAQIFEGWTGLGKSAEQITPAETEDLKARIRTAIGVRMKDLVGEGLSCKDAARVACGKSVV